MRDNAVTIPPSSNAPTRVYFFAFFAGETVELLLTNVKSNTQMHLPHGNNQTVNW
jgi:hypothetical protein